MSENAKAESPAPEKKKLPLKTIVIVAALMVAEAAGVLAFVGITDRKPQAVEAKELHDDELHDTEKTVEVQLLADKFQNLQTGRVWFWDAEIVMVVKTRNEAFVKSEMERRRAEIAEGVSTIFRKAQHSQLKEPGLETINRQVGSYMNRVMGKDADGEDRIVRLIIPKCRGIQAD